MSRAIFSAFFISIILLIDVYAFQAFRTAFDLPLRRVVSIVYWVLSIIVLATFLFGFFGDVRGMPKVLGTYLFTSVFILIISKFIICIFLLVDDSGRFIRWVSDKLSSSVTDEESSTINRSAFISQLAIITASVPLLATLWGVFRSAYNYQVKRVSLKIKNLPHAFEGFTIAQISDIHSGSFYQKEPIVKGIELINSLNADAIFFTGDLVNDLAHEMDEYIDIFKKLSAKEGVFSVTGNHDYGIYTHGMQWNEARRKNFEDFKEVHRKMGWNLLLNENQLIERDGEKLAIIGVENWGKSRHFPKYGDIDLAKTGTENIAVKLLLSHDPTHWQEIILNEGHHDIDVTFSGHTHGCQIGINLGKIKWSPVQYFYKHWMGLYEQNDQQLYVNPGFGFLGFPGRVGILPEVSLFTLERA